MANVYLCGAKLDPSWWAQRGEGRVGPGMRPGRIKAIIPLWAPPSRALLSPLTSGRIPGPGEMRFTSHKTRVCWCQEPHPWHWHHLVHTMWPRCHDTHCSGPDCLCTQASQNWFLHLHSAHCHLGSCRGGVTSPVTFYTQLQIWKLQLFADWKSAQLQYLEFIILEFPAVSGFVNSCGNPLRFAGYYHGILLLLLSPMGGTGMTSPTDPSATPRPGGGSPHYSPSDPARTGAGTGCSKTLHSELLSPEPHVRWWRREQWSSQSE